MYEEDEQAERGTFLIDEKAEKLRRAERVQKLEHIDY